MSSSTHSRPAVKPSKGSKAAIIRPVNRRGGQQSYVRIDPAHATNGPNIRAVQLEDYVAQIRGHEATEDTQPQTPVEITAQPEKLDASPDAKTRIVRDTARKQLNSSAELTQVDHLNILKAVAKLDSGYEWIEESNRTAAAESRQIASQLAESMRLEVADELKPVEIKTTTQPISQSLVNDIAAAIASVLTDRSEGEMLEKISDTDSALADNEPELMIEPSFMKEIEALRLSPELPKPEYTLPVTDTEFTIKPNPEPETIEEELPPAAHTISLSAAAWDVPAFRWPAVSDQILAVKNVLSGLAANCESMLSPFGKTIAVTAPTRGQGTTTMSITLARLFASSGKRVLLIDGDIMKPQLSTEIGIKGVSWFRNSESMTPVGECVIHGRDSGVCVMPLDGPVSNVAPYSDPIFDQLEARVDKIRGEFDVIVIDAGPVWQIVDEMSGNSHLVDVAMMVNQDTHSNGFAEARERMMDRGVFKFIAAQNAFARRAG